MSTDGFGDSSNGAVSNLATFENMLYAGTSNSGGAQIWRSSNGTNWDLGDGVGDPGNFMVSSLLAFGDDLYAVASNPTTGLEELAPL